MDVESGFGAANIVIAHVCVGVDAHDGARRWSGQHAEL